MMSSEEADLDDFLEDGCSVLPDGFSQGLAEFQSSDSDGPTDRPIRAPEGSDSQATTFNAAWVDSLYREHLEQVKREGYTACLWSVVLQKWKSSIAHVPVDDVEIGCVRSILQCARLAPTPQPSFYETLRKLGKDILCRDTEEESTRKDLLERLLTPEDDDSQPCFDYFGSREKWMKDSRSLANHLEKLHAHYGSSLSQELIKEEILGFVVSHIRSNRYHHVELAAIIKHLIREIPSDVSQRWSNLINILESDSPTKDHGKEAEAFIMRCFENMYRARQSFEGAEKRNGAVGVIFFGDISSNSEHGAMERSFLDKWYEEQVEKSHSLPEVSKLLFETSCLKQIRSLIRQEQEQWEKWELKLKMRKGTDFKISKQGLFSTLNAEKLSSSSLLTQLTNSVKAYCEKKKILRELAEKSSRKACVLKAIKDATIDSSIPSIDASGGDRLIAVFGYKNYDEKGVPETAEQSVIVRSVALDRGEEAANGEFDARIFEIGVSLAGTYLEFTPTDSREIQEMFRTSGLGLGYNEKVNNDKMHFFQFVPNGQHCPKSKPIDDILHPAGLDAGTYSHILLTIPDAPGRQNATAYSDIADAGGRFLMDLKRVGSCKTDGMKYHSLAVESAASVAVDNDGKTKPFRRLAVLLPPTLPNEMPSTYQLGDLGKEAPRGKGFQESAEIIAEVLSLVAIDKSKIDDDAKSSKYRGLIKNRLEGNPLLLYYTSIELLDTVDPTFARIIAEHWEEKLGLDQKGFAANLSLDEQESRRLVLSLITSGIQRGGGYVVDAMHRSGTGPGGVIEKPARHSLGGDGKFFQQQASFSTARDDKSIALANEAHLRLLPTIIQRETHFAQEEVFVEESNFESVLLRLKRSSPASLTFVFVYITGRISADQINQLVTTRVPSIKLIFRYSASLVTLLDLTPFIRDAIYRPDSIKDALTNKMKPVAYTNQTAVGAMVLHNTKLLADNPCLLCKPGDYWDDEYPEKFAEEAASWKESILEWALTRFEDGDDAQEYFRMLVSSDHSMSSRLLQGQFSQLEPPILCHDVDAGDRTRFDDLKSFLDCKTSVAFSYSSVRCKAAQTTRSENSSNSQNIAEIFILRRSSFLPHSKLEALLSHCFARRTKLLLLCNEPTSVLSRFRVFKDNASPPVWVRIPSIIQREFCCSNEAPCATLAINGLQMLFSHDFVVSDVHCKLEKLLDGGLFGGGQNGEFHFLDQIAGIPTDPTLRASILSAFASNDDLCNSRLWSSKDTQAKKITLGEILATHINRYLRFPMKAKINRISFGDFCWQPRVRFLSQIHRVDAYMCYIFSKTANDKRLCSSLNPDLPFGFPISVCFSGVSKNTHTASNPGILLNDHFDRDVSLLEPVKISIAEPQYIDPGRGDVVTHLQEIAERRAISGAEMHWEEMHVKWESGPEISDDIIDHILIHSPSRISVLLSMTPPQIVNLSPSIKALQAIASDFENVEVSLRLPPTELQRSLRIRTAAISWLLLTKCESYVLGCEDKFVEDQSLLTENGIFINLKVDPNDSENHRTMDILFRVTKALIQLDTPDTLTIQHSVRDFLLSNANSELIGKILDNPDVKLGRAFINACVARESLNMILSRTAGTAVCDRIGNVLKWVKEPIAGNVESMRKDMTSLASRITPEGIACLLTNANPPLDLEKARDGIFEAYIKQTERRHGNTGGALLDDVLTCLCNDNCRGLAVELFDKLTRCTSRESQFPVPKLERVIPTWHQMYCAMKDPSETRSLLQSAQDHKFILPFEVSERLCELYVQFYCVDGRDVEKDIDQHAALLKSDLSRDAVYKYMINHAASFPVNTSAMALVWYTWWSKPWSSFPLQFMPTRESWNIFQSVTRKISINEEKAAHGLSTLAKFAVAPHTLPASTANALKYAMVCDEPVVISRKYVLAQFRSSTYPVYGFRMHQRYLPRDCIDLIISEMKERKLPGFIKADRKECLKALFPITDSGMSTDMAAHNLNILVYIHESERSLKADATATMRAQIFLPTLAWFYAAGFSMNDLKSVLDDQAKMRFVNNYAAMANIWGDPNFLQAPVYFPLPVYVDVRFVCGKAGILFQCNPESASVTVQWLGMLGLQYGLDTSSVAERFHEHALCRNTEQFDVNLPKFIVRQIMRDVARVLVERHKDVDIGDCDVGKHHVVFVLDESGSMDGAPWQSVAQSVKDFLKVRLLDGAHDRISVIAFDHKARTVFENTPIVDCHRQLDAGLTIKGQLEGGTAFGPALQLAHALLTKGRSDQTYKPLLIFMSDGASNTSKLDGDTEMEAIARDFLPDISVKTIAFGDGADREKLKKLAKIGQGKFDVAVNGDDMRKRFTVVAAELGKRRADKDENATACSEVVDDCIALADFFAQLRIGSQTFARCAFQGLSEGLKEGEASQALQVCVADALYMLIGVTPLNLGVEVTHLLEAWREKELTIGSSVLMEITYMATEVYKKYGLIELAESLIAQVEDVDPALKRVHYVRNPASISLASELKEPAKNAETNLYSFSSCTLIACPGRVRSAPEGERKASERVENVRSISDLRVADFDHVKIKMHRTSYPRDQNPRDSALASIQDGNERKDDASLFKSASNDGIYAGGCQLHFQFSGMSRGALTKPRTISARELVVVDTGPANDHYSGYAVVRIVPGLHPVLRCPGDSRNIPVSQQKSLAGLRERDSLDPEDRKTAGKRAKIEAIFSNNGGTWNNLSQLPIGSTIMGKGFYLRKGSEGWVFLITATDVASLEHPPYVLWCILDTLKLAALDFAEIVVEALKAIVALSYRPNFRKSMDDEKLAKMLNRLRLWRDESKSEYLEYLKREYIVCKHLLRFMNVARTEASGALLMDIFEPDALEKELGVPVRAAEEGISRIITHLSQFIGLRDWVPRSQLTFTLELVLANHSSHLNDFQSKSGNKKSTDNSKDLLDEEEFSATKSFWALDEGPDVPDKASDSVPGSSFPKNKLIAAHEHITQRKFYKQSLDIVQSIEKRKQMFNEVAWINAFSDSDDEEGDMPVAQVPSKKVQSVDDNVINNARRERGIAGTRSNESNYDDDKYDMPQRFSMHKPRLTNTLFPRQWGYGYQICSPFCVPSLFGNPVPLYFVQIDVRRLKMAYSDASGLPIAFIFHKKLLDRSLKAFKIDGERQGYEEKRNGVRHRESQRTAISGAGTRGVECFEEDTESSENDSECCEDDEINDVDEGSSEPCEEDAENTGETMHADVYNASAETRIDDSMLAYREELLRWLTDLIRSPLPINAKDWFLDKLRNGATACCVPLLSISDSKESEDCDLNLLVIAHCIAAALPSPNDCRELFRTAFQIPNDFLLFCKRKNDLYGVHIVRGGTLQELQERGAVVEICNLGYDALTRSKDNASMYLTIIGHFSTFTWLVYVTGLDHIDDALLKWIAEYTKAHPWRFIYLENTQTSWNFSENRDRCIYDRAPIPVERTIRIESDLQKPEVHLLRPTHTQPYPRVVEHCHNLGTDEHKLQTASNWKTLSNFTRSFFRNVSTHAVASDAASAITDWTSACDPACKADYRRDMMEIFKSKEPCIVLLCSPPGAGKSHFSNELAEMLKRSLGIGRAFIDGSDDRLVDMALTEILNVELSDSCKSQFLVVDEFHMLKEHHKQDLFGWLEVNAKRLHVLLIANRKDANDEKLLEDLRKKGSAAGVSADRICHVSTRLGNELLNEVMQKRRTVKNIQVKIRRWMHCCRCLFGGEAVSLRAIGALDEKLKEIESRASTQYDLVSLLLDKVPMVSEATAQEFVTAFLATFDTNQDPIASIARMIKGPVSLMVQAALLTEDEDLNGMDYPDFVSFGVERAYDAPPALRIAAWCCHMQFHMRMQQDRIDFMDDPKYLFQCAFVDQCGFPLQLEEPPGPRLSQGLAFSWGGDYSRLEDIIDAVRHGHSVDWADVSRRCWSCEPVQDSKLLIELLSVCTSPGKVLNALRKDNLCSLLKKSSPDDSLNIALEVLKHRTHFASAKSDRFLSPYRTAIWMTLCYDKSLSDPKGILERMCVSDDEKDLHHGRESHRATDWRENELVEALTWACTHMTDMITCRSDDDPVLRTRVLKSTLLYLTENVISAGDNERATRLWGGMFAPLLHANRKPDCGNTIAEASVMVHVAVHAEDACGNWKEPLPLLWAIAHGKGTAAQVADVWAQYPHFLLVDCGARSDEPVHPIFAAGVLCVVGVIPSDLQLALLTRGGSVDLSLIGHRLDHAVNQVRGAVESLVLDQVKGDRKSRISIADGPFRDVVLRQAERIREEYA